MEELHVASKEWDEVVEQIRKRILETSSLRFIKESGDRWSGRYNQCQWAS